MVYLEEKNSCPPPLPPKNKVTFVAFFEKEIFLKNAQTKYLSGPEERGGGRPPMVLYEEDGKDGGGGK